MGRTSFLRGFLDSSSSHNVRLSPHVIEFFANKENVAGVYVYYLWPNRHFTEYGHQSGKIFPGELVLLIYPFFGTLTLNDTRSPLKNFYEEFSWLWAHPILWLSSQCPYNGNTLHSGETHSNAHLGSNQRSASLVSEGETRKFCQVLF